MTILNDVLPINLKRYSILFVDFSSLLMTIYDEK